MRECLEALPTGERAAIGDVPGVKPAPSSETSSATASSRYDKVTLTRSASACCAALAVNSCAARSSVTSTAPGKRSRCSDDPELGAGVGVHRPSTRAGGAPRAVRPSPTRAGAWRRSAGVTRRGSPAPSPRSLPAAPVALTERRTLRRPTQQHDRGEALGERVVDLTGDPGPFLEDALRTLGRRPVPLRVSLSWSISSVQLSVPELGSMHRHRDRGAHEEHAGRDDRRPGRCVDDQPAAIHTADANPDSAIPTKGRSAQAV